MKLVGKDETVLMKNRDATAIVGNLDYEKEVPLERAGQAADWHIGERRPAKRRFV